MRRIQRIKIVFEHCDGARETHELSPALANILIHEVLKPGWPYMDAFVEGKRLVKTTEAMNAYVDENGQEVYL